MLLLLQWKIFKDIINLKSNHFKKLCGYIAFTYMPYLSSNQSILVITSVAVNGSRVPFRGSGYLEPLTIVLEPIIGVVVRGPTVPFSGSRCMEPLTTLLELLTSVVVIGSSIPFGGSGGSVH